METGIDYIALSGITTAIVQVLKQLDPSDKYTRFYPLGSLIVGFALGMFTGIPWLMSLTIGLTASGFYAQMKTLAKG